MIHKKLSKIDFMRNRARAAMFGLDARIALSIFSALSIIVGAVLYYAKENAKVNALITELEEVGKAYDAYVLDTGNTLNKVTYGDVFVATDSLIQNTIDPVGGWKGPYLSYPDWADANRHALQHPIYNMVYLARSEKIAGNYKKCEGVNTCYIVTGMNGVPFDLAVKLDKKIDGVKDNNEGDFRYGTTPPIHIFYYYRPAINNATY